MDYEKAKKQSDTLQEMKGLKYYFSGKLATVIDVSEMQVKPGEYEVHVLGKDGLEYYSAFVSENRLLPLK